MVKKIAMTLLSTVLSSSLYAGSMAQSEKFVGIEAGPAKVQGDSVRGDETGIEFGLRVGAQLDQWRSMVLLNYFDEGDHNTEKLMVSVDYFIFDTQEGGRYFNPYLGANMGYASYEVSYQEDTDAFLYGAQFGFVSEIMDSLDIDVGYRYSLAGADEFDHMGTAFVGLNYLY